MPTTSTFQFASAVSDSPDTADAAVQAVEQVADKVADPADLVAVFTTPDHRDGFDVIREVLSAALRPRVIIGTTAGGVIGVQREVERGPGLSVLVVRAPGATIRGFHSSTLEADNAWNEPDALRRFFAGPDANEGQPKAVVMFADPFTTPMGGMLPAMAEALPGTPVIGGMASGAREAGGNRLLLNDAVHDRGAVGVVIGGAVRVDCTVSQGCRPIGKPHVITKAKRNVIMELGARNALQVARDMLENLDDEDRHLLQTNGWQIGRVINEYKDRFGRGDFLIRQVIGIDPNVGYLAVGDAQVRVGQTIQFHVRDQKTARQDFAMLLEMQKLHGPEGGALLFSCNGRGTNLFSDPNADADMVHDALGDLPLAGFFAAGEIGSVGHGNFLHGHTACLAVIRPDQSP